tara:strand:+ start:624 stop:1136 length:513 start_codon:yes stop_codon:yes gene_type:complete
MIKHLIRLANHLDSKGLRKEADILDGIIVTAEEWQLDEDEASLDTGDWDDGLTGDGRGLSQYEMSDSGEISHRDVSVQESSDETASFEEGGLTILNSEDIEMQLLENRDEALQMINDLKNATVANLTNVTRALRDGRVLEDYTSDALWSAFAASEKLKDVFFPDDLMGEK